jgi:type II secretory ATPase GspE/PulE/Tfp pilus assembly ATPase PilB-like protein
MNGFLKTRSPTLPGLESLPGLHWPSPPYASYGDVPASWMCELDGMNRNIKNCQLEAIKSDERLLLLSMPPSSTVVPIRFSMFQCLRLREPLCPTLTLSAADDFAAHDALLQHRPRVPYQLEMKTGPLLEGTTIGHVENDAGLFLFPPLDETDRVQCLFFPKEAYSQIHLGEHIGQILVQQQTVTAEQVERVAMEQESLRARKLGDYLVHKEVVSADQLLQALDQQSQMPMVRIGESLTALGLISDAQLSDALDKQKTERKLPLGELLVQSGMLTRQDLQTALARKMGFPVVDVSNFPIDIDALRKVPFSIAKRLRVLPLILREGTLVVAAEDPSKRSMIDELEFTSQTKVVAAIAGIPQLAVALPQAYARLAVESAAAQHERVDQSPDNSSAELLRESLEQQSIEGPEEIEPQIEQSDNSLVRLINTMIIDASNQGASDIHIETYATKRKVRIRFRKDGILSSYMELPHTYRSALIARIKIMCELDISERRKPQDGKIDFVRFSAKHRLELRVATIPTLGGAEDVVMRVLSSAKPVAMNQLGLSEENFVGLREAASRPYGMVLCVGPTGSGKTTTLHSILQHLSTPERKIWTAEDPVEITNPDLRQVQVNTKIDWTFAKALRAFLRADPDIVMVGEIRDKETAQVAIEASLTGHMMLSTLHTNSAAETIIRLLDMGMDPFNFADALLGVLAQRLARRLCTDCKSVEAADDAFVDELLVDYLRAFPEDVRISKDTLQTQWEQRFAGSGPLLRYRAVGCAKCNGVGYKGRLGLHELLTVEPGIRHLIQTNGRPEEIQYAAMRTGHFRTLRQDGIEKVLQGLTSIDEVRANCNA